MDTCPVDALVGFGDLSSIFGMLWRFIPMTDPTVSVMASRDLDSLLTSREAAAVTQWLEETEEPFHVMRDNPHHGTEILGGMWGARMDTGHREEFRGVMGELLEAARGQSWIKGRDQSLLSKHVWPKVRDLSCVHDSYLCDKIKGGHWRPFPTQREEGAYNFVGAAGPMNIHNKCPEQCRPQDHQDWTMC